MLFYLKHSDAATGVINHPVSHVYTEWKLAVFMKKLVVLAGKGIRPSTLRSCVYIPFLWQDFVERSKIFSKVWQLLKKKLNTSTPFLKAENVDIFEWFLELKGAKNTSKDFFKN